jgi:hypothetical protein
MDMYEQNNSNGQNNMLIGLKKRKQVYVRRQILAGGSLLRSGQTQVGEPKIGEHAQ